MFKTITIILAVVIIAILILAARKPDHFTVQRSVSIKAAPEKIFPYLNNLHNFTAWSPFEKLDPDMKRSYNGVASGKGATYEWEGSGKAGQGRMEIVDETMPSKVVIKLDFTKPFKASNMVEYTLTAKGDATEVTWAMSGAAPFLVRIIHVFFDMDSMVGKDFEDGLNKLKDLAEKQ
ncbi:SRPBCC family protein [Herbaspirillum rhizosphaerae]|uniref:SRPBCC family protein n=1 Tax=Herbaspirillum rhizosphaerae TaxID=346179 RepID=UPI00067C01C6|nr:SRPBCC family protein [Herbaspirillum rhizosphaerae]